MSSKLQDNFEIRKTLIASTSHAKGSDFTTIAENGIIYDDMTYGVRVFIGGEEPLLERLPNLKFSEGLNLLILFAASSGCEWLELDSDGFVYEGIPSYEW